MDRCFGIAPLRQMKSAMATVSSGVNAHVATPCVRTGSKLSLERRAQEARIGVTKERDEHASGAAVDDARDQLRRHRKPAW
jgi:hypothetical protein